MTDTDLNQGIEETLTYISGLMERLYSDDYCNCEDGSARERGDGECYCEDEIQAEIVEVPVWVHVLAHGGDCPRGDACCERHELRKDCTCDLAGGFYVVLCDGRERLRARWSDQKARLELDRHGGPGWETVELDAEQTKNLGWFCDYMEGVADMFLDATP